MTPAQQIISSILTFNLILFFLEDRQKCRLCSGTGKVQPEFPPKQGLSLTRSYRSRLRYRASRV